MAAYFVKVRRYGAKDLDSVIIDYEKFEKVDAQSFYKKVHNKITGCEIIDVVKL